MHLHSYKLSNYRRMRSTHISLASDISIFVGANNSGKTSATQAIQTFLAGQKERLSLYDFSSSVWSALDVLGEQPEGEADPNALPKISLDLWFEVAADDLYLVLPLLPSTSWEGTLVGVRIEFSPKDPAELLENFRVAKNDANANLDNLGDAANSYVPWPKNLSDYLQRELTKEYEFKYFVLDRARFDEKFVEEANYEPLPLLGDDKGGAILRSLVRVDNLDAQRHLADSVSNQATGSGRAEDLSKRLSRFYQRNLDQRQADHGALMALFNSEKELNKHLADVFKDTLTKLQTLGYPGFQNPKMVIKSALNPESIMRQDARVHYALDDAEDGNALPDTYNGLGFKNLIYMVVELLDHHATWVGEEEGRPPLHLVFIEEPEAHLHAQLQQVFVRNVLELLKEQNPGPFASQLVVTTHSPHILYERGFRPIRYFRRDKDEQGHQVTEVLNLSAYYDSTPADRDFLERYLKLTHCDLFFSDAAILVEGNVERLLMPVMIESASKSLRSTCLCILEVGGAFGHRFKSLIEFLGLTTLIITDLDSVEVLTSETDTNEEDSIEFEEPDTENPETPKLKSGKACWAGTDGAVTSNQMLMQWLPKKSKVSELLAADVGEKTADANSHKVRVAYQTAKGVTWNGATSSLAGRTLEESFGLENAEWCQDSAQRGLGLKLRTSPSTPEDLAKGLHRRVKGTAFDKTKFALGVLSYPTSNWKVPEYIAEGLVWLAGEVAKEEELEIVPQTDVVDAHPEAAE